MPENTSEYLPNIPEISFSLKAFETVSPPIDETLSKPMNAADAKATGDALDETASDIADTSIALMNDYLHISPQTLTSAQKAHVKQQLGLLNLFYPVGAVYISFNSTSPATLFGGTWTKIENTYLISASANYTPGSSGGNPAHALSRSRSTGWTRLSAAQTGRVEHTHDHTVVMPKHTHDFADNTQDPVATLKTRMSYVGSTGDLTVHLIRMIGTAKNDIVETAALGGTVRGVSGDVSMDGDIHSTEGNASESHNHTVHVSCIAQTMPTWVSVNMWRRTA